MPSHQEMTDRRVPLALRARPAISGSRRAYLYDTTDESAPGPELCATVDTHVLDPAHNFTVAREIARRYNAHDSLVALLSALEWSGSSVAPDEVIQCCPQCDGLNPDQPIFDDGPSLDYLYGERGHAPTCRLAALLDAEREAANV